MFSLASEYEPRRLEALNRLGMMDTPPEPEFDELVTLAAAICGTPISLVSLLDDHRQWFKAVVGLDVRETPRGVAFCAHSIKQEDLFIVEDAESDPRFAKNPLVTGSPSIRFYAGMPIRTPEGFPVGTLCVIDREPRKLDPTQLEALRILGRQVSSRMELRVKRKQLERALEDTERARAQLAANERRFRTFMDSGPFVSYIKDADGRMLYYNTPFSKQFGVTEQQMLGKTDAELWPKEFAAKYRAHDLEVLRERKLKVVEEAAHSSHGEISYWKSYKFPCQEADGTLLLGGISLDVTESRAREDKLHRYQNDLENLNQRLLELATTDPLTGLANRRVFDEHLASEFALARRRGRSLSLMLLDMDDFKKMNDSYGHDQGDRVLKQLAALLCRLVRETDLVVRYGGEEFILLLPDTDEAQAMILGERVLTAVRAEDFGRGPATISGGVAELTAWCPNPKHMVSCADEALYAAKRAGKDRVVGYAAYQAIVNAELRRELGEVG